MEQINRKDLRRNFLKIQRSLVSLSALLLVCFFAFGETAAEIVCDKPEFHPSLPEGLAAMVDTDEVSVREIEVTLWPGSKPAPADDNSYFVFEPRNIVPTIGLILHPGGNCDPRAYAPMAKAIASDGYLVAILPMPNCVSIGGYDRTAKVIEDFGEIEKWILAGHSVGGASIAQYTYEYGGIAGLVMLAALGHTGYPLDDTHNVKVLSLYGGKDTHLLSERILVEFVDLLPTDTEYVEIEGGNHTQFAWLDPVPDLYLGDDGPADITYQEQQDIIVQYILDFLGSFDDTELCPLVSLWGEHSQQVMSLRRFRDELLAKSTAGQRLIRSYYLHAGTITRIFDNHPAVRRSAKKVLTLLVPIVNKLL